MSTRMVVAFEPGVYTYEIGAEPLAFDQAESHAALGGEVVVLRNDVVAGVLGDGVGPTFAGLWEGCTFHLLVRRIEND